MSLSVRGWRRVEKTLGRLDFFSLLLLAFSIIRFSLSWRSWRQGIKGNERDFFFIVGLKVGSGGGLVDGELNSFEGCRMNEFFSPPSPSNSLLFFYYSLRLSSFSFHFILFFCSTTPKSASTILNVNEGTQAAEQRRIFLFSHRSTASTHWTELPQTLLVIVSNELFFLDSSMLVAVVYIFFIYSKESEKMFFCCCCCCRQFLRVWGSRDF